MLPMRLFTHFKCHCYPVVTRYPRETEGWFRVNKWEVWMRSPSSYPSHPWTGIERVTTGWTSHLLPLSHPQVSRWYRKTTGQQWHPKWMKSSISNTGIFVNRLNSEVKRKGKKWMMQDILTEIVICNGHLKREDIFKKIFVN